MQSNQEGTLRRIREEYQLKQCPPRRMPVLGTFETCRWHLTKSVIKGKADFPVARYDFSV